MKVLHVFWSPKTLGRRWTFPRTSREMDGEVREDNPGRESLLSELQRALESGVGDGLGVGVREVPGVVVSRGEPRKRAGRGRQTCREHTREGVEGSPNRGYGGRPGWAMGESSVDTVDSRAEGTNEPTEALSRVEGRDPRRPKLELDRREWDPYRRGARSPSTYVGSSNLLSTRVLS